MNFSSLIGEQILFLLVFSFFDCFVLLSKLRLFHSIRCNLFKFEKSDTEFKQKHSIVYVMVYKNTYYFELRYTLSPEKLFVLEELENQFNFMEEKKKRI